jgi:hypothetical protein
LGANGRGNSLKLKKELLSELELLEVLEEDNIISGDQYARKGNIQANLMKSMRRKKLIGLVDQVRSGCWKGIIILLTFIEFLMAEKEKIQCTL